MILAFLGIKKLCSFASTFNNGAIPLLYSVPAKAQKMNH